MEYDLAQQDRLLCNAARENRGIISTPRVKGLNVLMPGFLDFLVALSSLNKDTANSGQTIYVGTAVRINEKQGNVGFLVVVIFG